MSTPTERQLEPDAAERYAHILVPTILGPFARALVQAAGLRPGETVIVAPGEIRDGAEVRIPASAAVLEPAAAEESH